MATRTTTVALEVMADTAAAVAGLSSVETAAPGAAREVGSLSSAAADAPAKLDAVAGSADGVDSAGSAATGALGALASGFELIGAEKAAAGLQSAALATDFLSGVGQSAALAVQAQGAATKALTVAQRAANAVMRANPIGLVVVAITLLIAGLVLAYNKSDTFRSIVQAAGRTGKAAMESVSAAVGVVVTWVRDRIPPVFGWFKDKAGAVIDPAKKALGFVVDAAKDVGEWAGKIPEKFEALKTKAESIGSALLSPFTAVKDALSWIADKIASLKPPDWLNNLPGLPFSGRSGGFGMPNTTTPAAPPPPASTSVVVNVSGALDPYAVAVQIRDLLARYNLATT